MTTAVELRGLLKRFAEQVVVDEVSLAIARGEFFSLLGASGCGKTTTLRMIAGFETPTAGQVFLAGEDITARPAHLRPVGMVFQHYALFPHLSVFENVAFALRLRRTSETEVRRRVGEALDMVRLPGLEHRTPAQLSGGQQQRVALARALVSRPTVVLLDEPLGALDLKLRKAMQLELKTLQREVGLTFVYVTHDQEEALTMSDRIAVMDRGKVVQLADPRTIYERPATRFVADFIGVSNFLQGRILEPRAGAGVLIELANNQVVRAIVASDFPVGHSVTVVIRPERMVLSPPSDESIELTAVTTWNNVPGTVRDVVYTGSDTQYFVDLGPCGVVTVRVPNGGGGRSSDDDTVATTVWANPGERVQVGWGVGNAAILKE